MNPTVDSRSIHNVRRKTDGGLEARLTVEFGLLGSLVLQAVGELSARTEPACPRETQHETPRTGS